MTGHDPLCSINLPQGVCRCAWLAEVRADERAKVLAEYTERDMRAIIQAERERIAQAIEAKMYPYPHLMDAAEVAARIARNGGRDE